MELYHKGYRDFNNLQGYDLQPEKAKELIQAFREETSINQPQITISTDGNYCGCMWIHSTWIGKIGIKTTIDVIPSATLRQSKATGKLAIFRASWIADYPDAENYLSLFYSKNFAPNGPNYTHFSNVQFDQWYESATKEIDENKRIKLYQKMDSLLISKAPIVPLYYDQSIRILHKKM